MSFNDNKRLDPNLSKSTKDVDDVFLSSDDEQLLTDEEIAEHKERLQKCQESIKQSVKQYELWAENITKRRMFAMSRLKALQRTKKLRMKFYDELMNFVVDADNSRLIPIDSNNSRRLESVESNNSVESDKTL